MLVLTNCLSDTPDEGCVKVASSLVNRMKQLDASILVASYERTSRLADRHLQVNKLLLTPQVAALAWKHRKSLLYIPFPARAISNALRTLVLSLFSGRRVRVLITMQAPETGLTRFLYRLSGASFVLLSQRATDFYANLVGADKARYLHTGVDLDRFCPVTEEKRRALKQSYGLDPDRKVVLHAGHMKKGRNIEQLLKIDPAHQVLLVTSTLTQADQDVALREQLASAPNIRIIDTYVPHIEELFQLADAYFFPVQDSSHCIDMPLSCLEAAACNLPIVTTRFGAMQEFEGKEGFLFFDSFSPEAIDAALNKAMSLDVNTRDAVVAYDWMPAAHDLISTVTDK